MLRHFFPRAVRVCGRSCATSVLTPKDAPTIPVAEELQEAKKQSLWHLIDVYRRREDEFTASHCLATLVMVDAEVSEKAHSKQGYQSNLRAAAELPDVKELVTRVAEASHTLKPHMFGNLLILAHVFGMEEDPAVVKPLSSNARAMLSRLTDNALNEILDAIGRQTNNSWTALVSSMIEVPETQKKELPVASSSQGYSEELLNRLPIARLLDPEAREKLTEHDLAKIADRTFCLGAIDPNDLHKIVAVYRNAGLRNLRFLRLIRDFAMVSWYHLSPENLMLLYKEFLAIGFEDKDFLVHCRKRLPFDKHIQEEYVEAQKHTFRMAVMTKWYRPWSQPKYGKPYAAPEWDTPVFNWVKLFMENYNFQKHLAPAINRERRLRGRIAPYPKDGIVCPWLYEDVYGGGKKRLPPGKGKRSVFRGYDFEA